MESSSPPLASNVQSEMTPSAAQDTNKLEERMMAEIAKEQSEKAAMYEKIQDLQRKLDLETLARIKAEEEVQAMKCAWNHETNEEKIEEYRQREREKLKIKLQQLAQHLQEEQDEEVQATILDGIVDIAAALQGQGSGPKKQNPCHQQ